MAENTALVGLAGLVRLVLRRSGDRRQLSATEPCLDALHPPGVWAVVRRNHRISGVVAVGCLALGAGAGFGSPGAARCGCVNTRPHRSFRRHALGALRLPHIASTFFGSWPAMLAVVVGLFIAGFAARGDRPTVAGVLAGLAVLLNASVVPGIAVVSAVLVLSSGASRSQIIRWVATAGASALAVCAWWLVPFLAGSSRLVRYHSPAFGSLDRRWRMAVGRIGGPGSGSRLGLATWRPCFSAFGHGRGCGARGHNIGRSLGYLRSERWLELPILVAVVAIAAATDPESRHRSARLMRPSFSVIVAMVAVLMVPTVGRWEFLPLAVWALWGLRPRISAWGGVLAWSLVLLWIPVLVVDSQPSTTATRLDFGHGVRHRRERPQTSTEPSTLIAGTSTNAGRRSTLHIGSTRGQQPHDPRAGYAPSQGLYGRDQCGSGVHLRRERHFVQGTWAAGNTRRPHWYDAWRAGDSLSLDSTAAADALGARWYVECDADNTFTVFEGPDIRSRRAQGSSPIQTKTHGTKPRLSGGWRWPQSPPRCELAVCLKYRCCGPALADEGAAAQLDRAAQGVDNANRTGPGVRDRAVTGMGMAARALGSMVVRPRRRTPQRWPRASSRPGPTPAPPNCAGTFQTTSTCWP